MSITRAQQDMLLAPLARQRVEKRDGFDYVNISDVRRYLLRIFGFGGFSYQVSEAEQVAHYTQPQKNDANKVNQVVAWKVKVTLTVPALDATYSEYAIGSSSQPSLIDAQDMAIKTAESDALKRCAVNLGDQFGLSLYFSDKRNTVFHSVQRVYAEPHVMQDGDASTLEPIAPEQDVQAIPEADLTVRPEVDYTYDGDAAGADDDSTGPDVTLPQVADLPEDFWQQMDAIRAATSKAKRLKLASDYRKTILGLGLTSGHPVMTPNGTAITIGAAFDTAIGGA